MRLGETVRQRLKPGRFCGFPGRLKLCPFKAWGLSAKGVECLRKLTILT